MPTNKRKLVDEDIHQDQDKNHSKGREIGSAQLDTQNELPIIPLKPKFNPISASATNNGKIEYRRIRCPQHRLTPLRAQWENIVSPIVEYLKLQIRYNTKSHSVELKTSELTEDSGAAQKGQDFIEAFMLGFDIQDAVALLRLDDLYIDSFMVTDVKMLHGDHLSRAIGRIAGQGYFSFRDFKFIILNFF